MTAIRREVLDAVDRIPSLGDRPHFWREVEKGHHVVLALQNGAPKPQGVLVLSRREGDDGARLWVELSTEPGFAARYRHEILGTLEETARAWGCEAIVFESTRPGWSSVATAIGFEALGTVTRYERKVT